MYKFLILIITILYITTFYYGVEGSAGFVKPIPRYKCDASTKGKSDGCTISSPCLQRKGNQVNPVYINDTYEVAIYQREARVTFNSSNTYTIQFFPDGSDVTANTGIQLLTFNQNDMTSNQSLYAVTVPDWKDNPKLADLEFDKDGYTFGYMQLTFDTRSGGGGVYYSCADVRLQLKPYKAPSSIGINVNGSLSISDAEGNQLGNATVAEGGSVDIPGLIEGTDPNAKGSEEIATQHHEDEDKPKDNSATKPSSFTLLPIIVSSISIFLSFVIFGGGNDKQY
eukprot:gene6051-7536_t